MLHMPKTHANPLISPKKALQCRCDHPVARLQLRDMMVILQATQPDIHGPRPI